MAATLKLETQLATIHYKIYPDFNTPSSAVFIEDVYLFGVVQEIDFETTCRAEEIVFLHHVKKGDLKATRETEPPLENEGRDWEEVAREANDSTLE